MHDLLGALAPASPRDGRQYVAELELTLADEAALLEIVKLWIDEERDRQLGDSQVWCAPIHALRALAELGSVEVVPTTLELLDRLDAIGDQWYLEELPSVCALVGAATVEPLARYLHDDSHGEYPRVAVAHSLCSVAQRDPATRDAVVDALVGVLGRREVELASLNAFVIGYLVDLRAEEHSELIREAFDANVVDTVACGSWPTISEELRFGRRPARWDFGSSTSDTVEARHRPPTKSARAAKNRQKAARKRNRKRK